MLTELVITVSLLAAPAAGPAPATPDDLESGLNNLEAAIDLHHVDAFVETARGIHMQVDYSIALGHVTISMRMGEGVPAWRD
ncbi:hypothetical protein [Nannocystis pusilla]|uniref:hypothetical protein n=1 Tax=Nannocystis pusilla TaxID=889268 RepID=UPI003B82A569